VLNVLKLLVLIIRYAAPIFVNIEYVHGSHGNKAKSAKVNGKNKMYYTNCWLLENSG